jgi:hypothetical protein
MWDCQEELVWESTGNYWLREVVTSMTLRSHNSHGFTLSLRWCLWLLCWMLSVEEFGQAGTHQEPLSLCVHHCSIWLRWPLETKDYLIVLLLPPKSHPCSSFGQIWHSYEDGDMQKHSFTSDQTTTWSTMQVIVATVHPWPGRSSAGSNGSHLILFYSQNNAIKTNS